MATLIEEYLMFLGLTGGNSGGGGGSSEKFNKIDGNIGIAGNIVLTEMVIDEVQ